MPQHTPIPEDQPNYGDDPKSPWRDPVPVSVPKRVMFILGFLAVVFALDRAIGAALGQLSARSQYRYSMLYAGRINADIAIVGNSRGVHSLFAPEISKRLGVKAYNLSMNGLGMDSLALIVADYLERNPPPKLLLIEVTSVENTLGETLPSFQPYFGASPLLQKELRTYSPARYWASRFLHAYRYNGGVPEKLLLYLRKDDQHWISPAGRIVSPEILAHRSIGTELHVQPAQVEAWKRIVAAAHAKGVTLIPFIAPYLPGAIGDRNLKAEYEQALMFPDLNTPPILDYSRAVEPEDAFSDRVHTNATGAQILLDKMIADGVFEGVARTRSLLE